MFLALPWEQQANTLLSRLNPTGTTPTTYALAFAGKNNTNQIAKRNIVAAGVRVRRIKSEDDAILSPCPARPPVPCPSAIQTGSRTPLRSTAASLYEAVVLAVAQFRRAELTGADHTVFNELVVEV